MNTFIEFIKNKFRWIRERPLSLPGESLPVNITQILMNPQRILIVPYHQMGKVLLATRVFKMIRDHYPSAQTTVVIHGNWSALVKGDPTIDTVISFGNYIDNPRSKEFQAFARDLATRQFDLALFISSQFSEPMAYLVRLSNAQVRISFWNPINEERGYFNVGVKSPDGSRYEVDRYLDMLHAVGIRGNIRDYTMAVSDSLREKARLRFLHSGVMTSPGQFVGFDLTKEFSEKPIEKKTAEYLLNVLVSHLKTQVVVFFEPGKKKLASNLKEVFGQQITLIEDRPVSMVAGLLSFCRFIVTLNTDLFQLAVALKIPTLSLLTREEMLQWSPGEKEFLVHLERSGNSWPSSDAIIKSVETIMQRTKKL